MCVNKANFTLAAKQLGTLQKQLRDPEDLVEMPPASLDIEDVKRHIERLHPAASPEDSLPELAIADPAEDDVLEVTAEEVDRVVRRLDRHSSHGFSGWVNGTIVWILTRNANADRNGDRRRALLGAFIDLVDNVACCPYPQAGR